MAALGRLWRRLRPTVTYEHDPAFDVFDRGCLVLTLDGRPVGHLGTTLSWFSTPLRPFTRQDWIWLLVVWGDGRRELPLENYPPWDRGYVVDLQEGRFLWNGTTYDATWLSADEAAGAWAELGISVDDF